MRKRLISIIFWIVFFIAGLFIKDIFDDIFGRYYDSSIVEYRYLLDGIKNDEALLMLMRTDRFQEADSILSSRIEGEMEMLDLAIKEKLIKKDSRLYRDVQKKLREAEKDQ